MTAEDVDMRAEMSLKCHFGCAAVKNWGFAQGNHSRIENGLRI